MFSAARGQGAFLNNRRLRVSKTSRLEESLISTGFPFHRNQTHIDEYLESFKAIMLKTIGVRRLGSAALDLAYVAAGRYDGFWEIGLSEWDIAAGTLLIQEAGGVISDLQGRDKHLASGNVLAGNIKVHRQMELLFKDSFGDNNWTSVLDIVDSGERALEELKQATDFNNVDGKGVRYLAPIPRPRSNVMCIGLNYSKHVDESTKIMGRKVELPEFPIVFTKSPSSVNSAYGDIPLDFDISEKYDWEVELGVIIGKAGKKIKPENAYEHIFGYTIINDVSVRDVQRRHKQFFLGKSFDGCCPMGPVIVTKDRYDI